MLYRQSSFAKGEVSRNVQGRVDQEALKTGLATARNCLLELTGAIMNRAGTVFICETKTPGETVGLLTFVFNQTQTYILIFGNQYIWIVKDDALLYNSSKDVTNITRGATCTVTTSTPHGYTAGQVVRFDDVEGMTQINGRQLKVASTPTAATFTLNEMDGTALDTTNYSAYVIRGTVASVYEVSSPYVTADLSLISYAQSADVIFLNCKGYEPRKLSRTGDTSWTLARQVFNNIYTPRTLAGTGTAGSGTQKYQVTAIYKGDSYALEDKESLAATCAVKTITGATRANPCVITCTNDFLSGDLVYIDGVVGMTELNGRVFKISVPTTYTPDTPVTIQSVTKSTAATNIPAADYTATVINSTSHGYANGDLVTFSVTGMTELNYLVSAKVANKTANTYEIVYPGTTVNIDSSLWASFTSGTSSRVSTNSSVGSSFTLVDIDSTNYTAYVSGGNAANTTLTVSGVADPTTSGPINLTWTATSTALSGGSSVATKTYNIYKESQGSFNWIGTSTSLTFQDKGITSTSIDTPPVYRELFFGEDNWPWLVIFHQQRLVYAGSNNKPDTLWMSAEGDYANFSIHSPVRDSDAVTVPLASNQVNEIRALATLRRLIVITSAQEWIIEGDDSGTVTPKVINAEVDDETGAAQIRPVVYGSRVLFVQAYGSLVRDLGYNFAINGYDGYDKTIYSSALFRGYTITATAFMKTPVPTFFAIRSDGKLLTMTYSPEQKFDGWTEHDTDGLFEGVCVIPNGAGGENCYFIVNRDGVRCLERLSTRLIDDVQDANFIDCATVYDGWNTTASTVRIHGSDYSAGELLDLDSVSALFADVVAGDAIFLRDADDEIVKATVITVTSPTALKVRPDRDVPTDLQNTYTDDWAHAKLSIPYCWQNEGQDVSIWGDGAVVASPNNSDYDIVTVALGVAVVPSPLAKAIVGRPYLSDIKTLAIEPGQGESLMDKRILITGATVSVEDSAGGFIGSAPPDDDSVDPLQDLDEILRPEDNDIGDSVVLQNDQVNVPVPSQYGSGGSIFLRMADPMPFKLLALGSAGYIPVRQ